MTEEQFEEVFYWAQELQDKRLSRIEVETAENALMGFGAKGATNFATIKQAGYIINVTCMDMAGNYEPKALNLVRKLYLENVRIIDEDEIIYIENAEIIDENEVIYIENERSKDIEPIRNDRLESLTRQIIGLEAIEVIEDEEVQRRLKTIQEILDEPDKCEKEDNSWERISIEKGLTIIERKGDVIFSEDSKGIRHQQLGGGDPYKVRNGSMTYSEITKIQGYTMKYNNNGIYGFAIFKGRKCLEKGYWIYDDVLSRIYKML